MYIYKITKIFFDVKSFNEGKNTPINKIDTNKDRASK